MTSESYLMCSQDYSDICISMCVMSMSNHFILVQGLFADCIYVGSSDHVRVLHLSHNEYAGYTLKHLLLRYMYNLSLPKLRATPLADPLLPGSTNE